jgi:ABC-type multidrug transport system ATPase subunit
MSSQPPASSPAGGVDGALPLGLHGLCKRWRKPPLTVLDDLELELATGEAVLVEGLNGVGKTTLLRIVAGLIGADSGVVHAFGLHPFRDRREYQRRVAFLSAGNTGVYARLTVRQQLDLWARVSFVPRSGRTATIDEAIDRFALGELQGRRSDRLSLGQRQRMRIAMTFVADPGLVLLDEPRSSLDGEGGELLAAAIRRTLERRGAVLWVAPTGEQFDFPFTRRYRLESGGLHELMP